MPDYNTPRFFCVWIDLGLERLKKLQRLNNHALQISPTMILIPNGTPEDPQYIHLRPYKSGTLISERTSTGTSQGQLFNIPWSKATNYIINRAAKLKCHFQVQK